MVIAPALDVISTLVTVPPAPPELANSQAVINSFSVMFPEVVFGNIPFSFCVRYACTAVLFRLKAFVGEVVLLAFCRKTVDNNILYKLSTA